MVAHGESAAQGVRGREERRRSSRGSPRARGRGRRQRGRNDGDTVVIDGLAGGGKGSVGAGERRLPSSILQIGRAHV